MRFALAFTVWTMLAAQSPALDYVSLKRDGKTLQAVGRVLVTAQDGGLLLEARDALLWNIPPEELIERTSDDKAFAYFDAAEMSKLLLAEFPPGFEIHATAHYLICHNTSKAYAQWCGALYERLYLAFTNYWANRGFKPQEPRLPLVAVVFADLASYERYSKPELGDSAKLIMGYYSLRSNRVNMYDLTGVETLRQSGERRSSSLQINALLAQPAAEPMVATIIHEATHQIAFNCGLHARYADVPVWLSEGLAVYFETPDLGSSKGWRTVGAVHRTRLARFRQSLPQRSKDSLISLISDDTRMRDARQAVDAYAEAWAWNYFLIRQRSKQYAEYLDGLSKKTPLIWDTPAERIAQFKAAFGDDLRKLDDEFLRYMQKVK